MIAGLTYWFDDATRVWLAYGREAIAAPDDGGGGGGTDPIPTTGYGSNVYGSAPYGS